MYPFSPTHVYIHIHVHVHIYIYIYIYTGFPSGSVVKNLPAMQEVQETGVQSLGEEDPLKEGMATHSRILPWRIHGRRSLVAKS